jgi:hypothetical protein
MEDVFDQILKELEATFRRLELQVPPPVKEAYKDGFVLRYREQMPQQAMLQKFARQISGLHTLRLLLKAGFLQEMCVIQRTLDDFEEDILFMACAIARNDWTEHHSRYLEYHWIEEQGETDGNRGQVPRKHIRAYVANCVGDDPSSMIAAGRRIYKGYSGMVHGNGEAIMDMCMNDPPIYLLAGMRSSPLYRDHKEDIWNYMYRGIVSSTYMARLFGDEELWNERFRALKSFENDFRDKIF